MPTSNGMRAHTGLLERTKWVVTDGGGRLSVEPVCCRNEASSLRAAGSLFGSIVLVGSYYQTTFSFFDVLSHHLPQIIAQRKTRGIFASSKTAKTNKP